METVFIYVLIDPRNDQVRYVGKSKDPVDRYRNHYNSARDKNTHKRNWINNIRKDGLRPELLIIDEVELDDWVFWECFYISLYKSYGFNLINYTSGGDGSTFGNKGSWKKGNVPHNKGVPRSEETKQKIRDNYVPNKGSYKKIIQYDINANLIRKYDCIKDAILESNGYFSYPRISDCCHGKRPQHRGFIWKFDDGSILSEPTYQKRVLVQFDKDMNELNRFDTIKEASSFTKLHSAGICACCKGKLKTSGGYIWKYLNKNK